MNGLRGFNSQLWPIRFKPLPDELLSSWLMRLSHGHGMKVQTFCNLIFGNRRQVWNRDIDRLAPAWLLDELIFRTGTPKDVAYGTTLKSFEGVLFGAHKPAGTLQWIQTLKMYHRKRQGFGLQLCPYCLQEDVIPYFRKAWRVTFNTICPIHRCMLIDRCPSCLIGIAFHRVETGDQKTESLNWSLSSCHHCGYEIANSIPEPIQLGIDNITNQLHLNLCNQLSHHIYTDLNTFNVMHQLSRLLVSTSTKVRLQEHLCEVLGHSSLSKTKIRIAIESRPIYERHHLMMLILWLMNDLEPRLRAAWRAKAIRYSHMTKDFSHAPAWFDDIVSKFSDWRTA